MNLARAAAREAERDLHAPLEHRMPAMAAEPACRAPDPGSLFHRYARAVRQAILLEAHIAAGGPSWHRAHAPDQPRTVQEAPARRQPRETRERLDADRLPRLPDHAAIPEILAGLRQDLGLAPDPAPPAQIRIAAVRLAPASHRRANPAPGHAEPPRGRGSG